MTDETFNLPDVGEGLTEAEIVQWKVAPGDEVNVNDVLVEIETAKSLVELPSPHAGKIGALLVNEGDVVEVGSPIITFGDGSAAPATQPEPESSGSVLVGYGTADAPKSRRKQRPVAERKTAAAPVPSSAGIQVLAKPPVRKLARDLGVDLGSVPATGSNGEVTRDDVMKAAEQKKVFRNLTTPEWPDAREERVPVKGVRKAIAGAMVESAFTAPHVTVFADVDATRTMEYVKKLKNSTTFAGVKVSPLLVMAKAVLWAVQRNPSINSTFTDSEVVIHHYVNLGIAAATPRGLLVPNIKEAQSKSMLELAESLQELTATARDGKTAPADMADGTITITNIGVFGVDTGTPILNPGEVAIIALGSIRKKPWVVDDRVEPRFVTTVAVTIDHRAVDGDVASRFAADLAAVLEEPALLVE